MPDVRHQSPVRSYPSSREDTSHVPRRRECTPPCRHRPARGHRGLPVGPSRAKGRPQDLHGHRARARHHPRLLQAPRIKRCRALHALHSTHSLRSGSQRLGHGNLQLSCPAPNAASLFVAPRKLSGHRAKASLGGAASTDLRTTRTHRTRSSHVTPSFLRSSPKGQVIGQRGQRRCLTPACSGLATLAADARR